MKNAVTVLQPALARGALRRNGARRIPAALLVCHLPDHQRTALDLLADQFELRRALLFGFLARRLHRITGRASAIEPITCAEPDSCLALTARAFSRNATNCWWRWIGIDLLRSPARSHVVVGRFAASAGENLTGGNTTRTLHRSTGWEAPNASA